MPVEQILLIKGLANLQSNQKPLIFVIPAQAGIQLSG